MHMYMYMCVYVYLKSFQITLSKPDRYLTSEKIKTQFYETLAIMSFKELLYAIYRYHYYSIQVNCISN